ncbi:fumarylacetoacetate hydrolase family protein [Paraburkholderia caribensis]|uniref:fumarylacetoacetate hydrolase family protein n=1 Tax=Paraburkholderia caribensis TaxID=75105 RepID=UPI001CB32F0C|nr:fumarylacetoacetate hydrolase family protein [Paraburkholderia caribensis]CAG9269631.1 Fumarylpyruvate hydrolase [Paraburkholderia caribensis]
MSIEYLFTAPPVASVSVRGTNARFPVRRLFFVGRNYHAHAAEMGRPVNKSVESPFYFTKSPTTLVGSGSVVAYPPGTNDFQHEMELVVAIGLGGFHVSEKDASELVYGYACGLDLTRRDLQLSARDKGRPWDLGKDFEQSSVVSEIVPMGGKVLSAGALEMSINGQLKQKSDLSKLIWNIPELIADLSKFYHLEQGDIIYTGTPEGVGPLQRGDRVEGHIEGVGSILITIA